MPCNDPKVSRDGATVPTEVFPEVIAAQRLRVQQELRQEHRRYQAVRLERLMAVGPEQGRDPIADFLAALNFGRKPESPPDVDTGVPLEVIDQTVAGISQLDETENAFG